MARIIVDEKVCKGCSMCINACPKKIIALASLVNAVAAGKIEKDAVVMLNITGGGEEHFKEDKELWYLKPSHVFPLEPDTDDVVAKVEALFAKNIAE